MSDEFENVESQVSSEQTAEVPEQAEQQPEINEAFIPEQENLAATTSQSADEYDFTIDIEPDSEVESHQATDSQNNQQDNIPNVSAQQVNDTVRQGDPIIQNQPYTQQSSPYAPQYAYTEPVTAVKEKKSGLKIFLSIVALIVVFAMGAGVATLYKSKNDNPEKSESITREDSGKVEMVISDTPSGNSSKAGTVLSGAEIAKKCRPSNVGILVYSENSNSSSAAGEGSGIVMAIDETKTYTYIITCAHVINDNDIIVSVETEDGTKYDADIVGYDTKTDIGVLRVKTTDLPVAEFGDSDALSIGDSVYAIGNPGGTEFFGSFTSGSVSAINRPVNSEIGYTMKCIQHDAAINPGNSGGMLVNQYGQVIGINSQKIAATAYEGIAFSIPISSAKEIIQNLITYGYVPNRPMIGFTYYSVSASTQYSMIAQIKGLPAGTLIINSISPDSDLNNTKARKYDMITAVNGKDLTKSDILIELIDNGKVGDKLTLSICRVNSNYTVEEFDVEVTLVEDKGTSYEEETTTQSYINPFDYFGNFGY